jgi:uncharacterized protein DUF4326
MSAPVRIQLSRAKGWRMPPNTVRVSRPSKWGNPFPIEDLTWIAVTLGFRADVAGRTACAVELHRRWLGLPARPGPLSKIDGGGVLVYEGGAQQTVADAARGIAAFMAAHQVPFKVPAPPSRAEIISELGGKNVACWCGLDRCCHGDTYLEIANP